MNSLKSNGDYLAREFARLMQPSKPQASMRKSASFDEEHGLTHEIDLDGSADPTAAELAMKDEDGDYYNEIDDIILESPDSDSYNLVSDSLDGEISDFDHYADDEDALDDKHAHILSGLSKIASSLRSKNEGFAADVVEATALSITNDLKKEASRNKFVKSELRKIASDLRVKGDSFASDLVLATINKI
jgi:hypothetical protein